MEHGKSKSELQLVSLKAGESETFNAGYHTLEFSSPVEIKASSFVVVVEIESSKGSITVPIESKMKEEEMWDSVTVEKEKCFIAAGNDLENCQWEDLGKLAEQNPALVNGDSSIKAFTTLELLDESLKNIEIITPPNKTSYLEGENFDKTGMVVKANYNSKSNPSVILDSSSYNITNGTDLKAGQTSVTITYEDKSVNQTISVEKNSVVELNIKTPPDKTSYLEGENFDKTGMVIEATYKDGTTKIISDYTIENGSNLKDNQTQITISYEEKTIEQLITVTPNSLIEIRVAKLPDKIEYIVGQDFDKTGMIITGTYQNGITQEILAYTIENGTNLTKGQSSVTITYEGKVTTQPITVEEKEITGITINKRPSKTQYIQNEEELDLTGGSIKVNYNDNSSEEIELMSEQIQVTGFDNKNLGKNTITVTYQSQTTTFDVEILAEPTPENSSFDEANCNIESVEYYTFSNKDEQEYLIIDITIDGIVKNTGNDSYEYYYYLSSNQDENNIQDWVRISENQTSSDKLEFKINTKDLKNYAELSDSNNLYVYVKEVVTKGGNQSVVVSKAMKMDSDVTVEIYLDNTKINNVNPGNNGISGTLNNGDDATVAPNILPQTGIKNILILALMVSIISMMIYIKYKKLNKYVK